VRRVIAAFVFRNRSPFFLKTGAAAGGSSC